MMWRDRTVGYRGRKIFARDGMMSSSIGRRLIVTSVAAIALYAREGLPTMPRGLESVGNDNDVFAQLDVPIGAEDRETPIAPGRQPVGRGASVMEETSALQWRRTKQVGDNTRAIATRWPSIGRSTWAANQAIKFPSAG